MKGVTIEPTGNSEKIRAPDGIRTHDPLWSSTDALTTELLETLWWARVKCGYLTRAASRSQRVKYRLTTYLITASCSHIESIIEWCGQPTTKWSFNDCSHCYCAMQLWAMLSVDIWLCGCVMQLESNTHISPLLTIESPVAQWLEHLY